MRHIIDIIIIIFIAVIAPFIGIFAAGIAHELVLALDLAGWSYATNTMTSTGPVTFFVGMAVTCGIWFCLGYYVSSPKSKNEK